MTQTYYSPFYPSTASIGSRGSTQPVVSAINGYLTNESKTLPALSDGTVTSYTGATGNFVVTFGFSDISSYFTLSSYSNPQALTVNYTGQTYTISGGLDVSEETADLIIRATGSGPYSGVTIDKTFSLAKSKAGAGGTGSPGAPGAPGVSPALIDLSATSFQFKYDSSDTPISFTNTFQATRQNTSTATVWTLYDSTGGGLISGSAATLASTSYFTRIDDDTITMTSTQFNNIHGGGTIPARLQLTLVAEIGSTGIRDKISFSKIKDGANGSPGTAGAPGATGPTGPTGATGPTTYTWVSYAYDNTGSTGFTNGLPGDRGWQGIAVNKSTPTESTTPSDYDWIPYRGPATFGLVAHANVIVGPDYIIKTGGGSAWNGSAYSSESFTSGAQVSFTNDSSSYVFMVGLNTDPTTDSSYASLDYAIYCAGSVLQVYENGGLAWNAGSVASGDKFQIVYDNLRISYRKNGTEFYGHSVTANQTLFLDTSINDMGVKISNLAFASAGKSGTDGSPGAPGTSPYQFDLSKSLVDIQLTNAGVIKSGQIPVYVNATVKQGTTDVTASCSFTLTPSDGSVIAASYSSGVITISTANAAGYIDVTPTISGTAIAAAKRIVITRTPDPTPPAAANSGSRQETVVVQYADTSVGAQSTQALAVAANTSGVINFNYYYLYTATNFVSSNPDSNMYATGKVQYRVAGGSTWSDATSETVGSIATQPGQAQQGEFAQGEWYANGSVSGLTSGTVYEFRAIFRRTVAWSGTGTSKQIGGPVQEYISQ